jgi:hypothetical protein
MTRLGYLQFTVFLMMAVLFLSSAAAVDMPPRGDVLAVHALRDGTALVAWYGDGADYITHVRADGSLLSAELAPHRIDVMPFASLDAAADVPAATYHGKPVTMHDDAIAIGGVDLELPHVFVHSTELVPARLQPLAGELPQFVGLETSDGPIVYDLETRAIVWQGDHDSVALIVRDGVHIYMLGWGELRAFDPLTFKMVPVIDKYATFDQIGGGFVWTYDHDEHAIDAPVVHALRSEPGAPVTASR